MADRIVLDEVIFEFVIVNNAFRVNAIDPRSGTEVTVIGRPTEREALKRVAKRKLEYVLTKRRDSEISR
ncbi:MAG: hypothetical protein OQJ99_11400 [Rhodospirillales bacterium]|nr:hypothetical protein [Rhodospirillales bacterium]MCW8862898.1 hypothetical protein [Rhodospirillales bacterium]MCW8952251.1 hypothetical protein [Rhodospirillales bacterium]MCW8969908.1 hypothetical protein [Rhodospirillales bacterium]MCW9001498.1 hypothetical protein [Rhodospirillales bacterium]